MIYLQKIFMYKTDENYSCFFGGKIELNISHIFQRDLCVTLLSLSFIYFGNVTKIYLTTCLKKKNNNNKPKKGNQRKHKRTL